MKQQKRFWLLGDSCDEEIYESLSWDLPGFKAFRRYLRPKSASSSVKSARPSKIFKVSGR
jgi:hypothetical protein